jgi:hypothetical protein
MAVLMYKVMQQVSVLRNHSLGPRSGIIGAKNSRQIRLLPEHRFNPPERFRSNHHICVYEENYVSSRVPRAIIAGGRRPRIPH